MTDALEIAEWLTRFEKKIGADEARGALEKLEDARKLFYDELGYNLTRRQFEALNQGENERNQYLIENDIKVGKSTRHEHKDGTITYQTNYFGYFINKNGEAQYGFIKSPFANDVKDIDDLSLPTAPRQGRGKRGYEDRKGRN